MWRSCARSRAAAFSLSLVLFFWFGWEIHQSVSHTLALLAAVLALFIVSLAYAERPTAMRAFLLGLIMGLGLMAKWSFLLVLLSLGVALAVTPETRGIFRERRTLLVLAGAALPILPFAAWVATIDPDLVGRRTIPSGRALSLDQALEGVAAFVTGVPLVFLPWIAFVLFFAWRFPKTPPGSPTLPQAAAISLASLTAIMTVTLMAAVFIASLASAASVRHHPLRRPLSLPVLPVRGAGAVRSRVAARAARAVYGEVGVCLAWRRHHHF